MCSREAKYHAGAYNYKYNGKELQDELGLNMYDYGARNYDPALGRTSTFDPNCQNYFSVSPNSFFANNPLSFTDPNGKDIVFWKFDEEKNKYIQTTFDKLDKNIKKGILNFLETDSGKQFFSLFAKDGDRIGKFLFKGNGAMSQHSLSFSQYTLEGGGEGNTDENLIGGKMMQFSIQLNTIQKNTDINYAETVGHEVFLHLYNDVMMLKKLYKKGNISAAFEYNTISSVNNKFGHKDHLAVKDDINGVAAKYFEFISQLKTVFNPTEVQKHVDKEIEKTYQHGESYKNQKKGAIYGGN
jgi:RHS repeat-associated protein